MGGPLIPPTPPQVCTTIVECELNEWQVSKQIFHLRVRGSHMAKEIETLCPHLKQFFITTLNSCKIYIFKN